MRTHLPRREPNRAASLCATQIGRLPMLALISTLLLTHHTAAVAAPAANDISEVFNSASGAVFRIQSAGGHGSGFLVGKEGLVVTNSHVVAGDPDVSVLIDDTTRLPAKILADDEFADLAVLQINPEAVAHIEPLNLKPEEDLRATLPGEDIVAIGFPLHQGKMVTSGVVGRVEDTAVIVDVNINQGNSGGPLLNMQSEVIGVNTFLDPGHGGAGVGGTVSVSQLYPVLVRARTRVGSPPPNTLLPTTPEIGFPPGGRRWAAEEESSESEYRLKWSCGQRSVRTPRQPRTGASMSRFFMEVGTPVRQFRGSGAGTGSDANYDWLQFVTDDREATVLVVVYPKIVPTGGSVAASLLLGTPTTALKHSGSVNSIEVASGGKVLAPIERVVTSTEITNIAGIKVTNAASYAVLKLSHDAFDPDFGETAITEVFFSITDNLNPGDECHAVADLQVLERVWADFEPYRDHLKGRRQPLNLKRAPGW